MRAAPHSPPARARLDGGPRGGRRRPQLDRRVVDGGRPVRSPRSRRPAGRRRPCRSPRSGRWRTRRRRGAPPRRRCPPASRAIWARKTAMSSSRPGYSIPVSARSCRVGSQKAVLSIASWFSARFIHSHERGAQRRLLAVLEGDHELAAGEAAAALRARVGHGRPLEAGALGERADLPVPDRYTGTCLARKISLAPEYLLPDPSQKSFGTRRSCTRSVKPVSASVALALSRAFFAVLADHHRCRTG